MKKKRALIIAHDYPPCGITSSRRPGGMVKYLPEYGWNAVVVTRKWTGENCKLDESIVPNMPMDVPTHEIDYRDKYTGIYGAFTQFIRFAMPPLHPFAYLREGRKVIDSVVSQGPFDVVWTTAPPANSIDLARYASEKCKVPLVVDFRDVLQWAPSLFVQLTMPLRLAHEKRALRSASAITAVSGGFANTLRNRHSIDVSTVSHGYDEELWTDTAPAKTGKFNIVYTGSLVLGKPDLRPLLTAITHLIERQEVDIRDMAIDFYGGGNSDRLREMFGDQKHASLVSDHGAVSRQQVLDAQKGATVLLVASHPGMPGWITSKMFEYIVARRPILSVPKDNDCVDQLLHETGTGVSCSTTEELEKQLKAWYVEWKSTGLVRCEGNTDSIRQYSAKNQAKALAEIFDRVSVQK